MTKTQNFEIRINQLRKLPFQASDDGGLDSGEEGEGGEEGEEGEEGEKEGRSDPACKVNFLQILDIERR